MVLSYQNEEYHKLKERFNTYYETKLLPLLQKNDEIRRHYFFLFLLLMALAFVLYPAIIVYILRSGFFSTDGDMAVGIILMISCFFILLLSGPVYFFKKKAKNGIMADFAGFFGSFSYENTACLPDAVIRGSDLFNGYNTHEGDDYFSGTYKDVAITISEECLKTVAYEQKNNKIRKKSRIVFDGICILLEMNKKFKGRTVVLKDHGIFNAFNGISGLERVRLEDSEFERIFEVYGNDQIEARYLLTAAFMERMLKLRDLFGGKSIQFSFKDNLLLIAVPTKQNMFEACSFFRSNINRDRIDLVFDQFCQIFAVIDILKLNLKTGL